jgi:hypothetical protein
VEKEDLLHMLEDANHNAERNETIIKVRPTFHAPTH